MFGDIFGYLLKEIDTLRPVGGSPTQQVLIALSKLPTILWDRFRLKLLLMWIFEKRKQRLMTNLFGGLCFFLIVLYRNGKFLMLMIRCFVFKAFVFLFCLVTELYPTLLRPQGCHPPGSFVHGISQAGILEWVAISFFRGSSQLGRILLCRQILYHLSHQWTPLIHSSTDNIMANVVPNLLLEKLKHAN